MGICGLLDFTYYTCPVNNSLECTKNLSSFSPNTHISIQVCFYKDALNVTVFHFHIYSLLILFTGMFLKQVNTIFVIRQNDRNHIEISLIVSVGGNALQVMRVT